MHWFAGFIVGVGMFFSSLLNFPHQTQPIVNVPATTTPAHTSNTVTKNAIATSSVANKPQASAPSYQFQSDLTIGSTGDEVVHLQQWLREYHYSILPPGVSVGQFGYLDKAALVKYQTEVGISPANGYFGSTTRSYINRGITTGKSSPPPSPSSSPSSSLAGCQNTRADMISIANAYLISKVGQNYFNAHYAPLGVVRAYGNSLPLVYYTYTLDGASYSIVSEFGAPVQDPVQAFADLDPADTGSMFMNVAFNNDCTKAQGAAAVLDNVTSVISADQAKSIAMSQGYTVTKVTFVFSGTRLETTGPNDLDLVPTYFVDTTKECTRLAINAQTDSVQVGNTCAIPL